MIRLQQHQRALGSAAHVTLVGASDTALAAAFEDVWQALRLFEQTFSRFLPDSELSYVNQNAGLPTPVSPEFTALARAAKTFTQHSEDLYNPFVLPALQQVGYIGSWPHVAQQDETLNYSKRQLVTGDMLQIGAQTVTIPADTALDFGGIGKGYALDELARVLAKHTIADYWISLGGDILAVGRDVDEKPWQIEVSHAETGASTACIQVTGKPRAVATSGTLKRAGAGWNHLIDPRTATSTTSNVIVASVAMASGTEADVYAKCLVLAGSEDAVMLAKKLAIKDYVLQIRDGNDRVDIVKRGAFI